MALQDDFENTISSLLCRYLLPTMDNALTKLAMNQTHHHNTIVAATPKHCNNSVPPCNWCGQTNHLVAQCKANFHSNGTCLSAPQALQITTAPISFTTTSCSQYGRTNHSLEQCKVVYHGNGTRLYASWSTMAATTPITESINFESSSNKFTFSTDDL